MIEMGGCERKKERRLCARVRVGKEERANERERKKRRRERERENERMRERVEGNERSQQSKKKITVLIHTNQYYYLSFL